MLTGVKIRHVFQKSPFYKAGLRSGDLIQTINGQEIEDELDFRFYAAADILELTVARKGVSYEFTVFRDEGSFLDLEFYEQKINCCKNRCIFCFIDQMPRGLRKSLYIKDEDFKHSFLNGNYVTLSSASEKDLQKVVNLGISPLYISVHATDTGIRNKMLGNSKAPSVMEQLDFLSRSGVYFHAQIVVCKGYNDGAVLKRTVEDLFRFNDALLSVAVVPVGLTRFRKKPLDPIDKDTADGICEMLEPIGLTYAHKDGVRKLFIADELFIKAGKPIPPRSYYEEYPQIENGVGLVRQLLEEWMYCRKQLKSSRVAVTKKSTLVVTSVSAYPFVQKIIKQLQADLPLSSFESIAVVNTYFGELVTVAGLLTAQDVIREVKNYKGVKGFERIVLPGVMFNYAGYTLDGFSSDRIGAALGLEVCVAGSLMEMVVVNKVNNKCKG